MKEKHFFIVQSLLSSFSQIIDCNFYILIGSVFYISISFLDLLYRISLLKIKKKVPWEDNSLKLWEKHDKIAIDLARKIVDCQFF